MPSQLVSVIIPVFQGESVIEGAVRSALSQTHRNIEVIVIDDGSTDRTLAVLEEIVDDRLIVLQQKNSGTAAARNLGLAQMHGNYVAFLDSDDRWFPTYLESALFALKGIVGIAYGDVYIVDNQGRLKNRAQKNRPRSNALDHLLDEGCFVYPSACVLDRQVIETIGFFRADCYQEDYEFMLRASLEFPFVSTEERLVVYRRSTYGKHLSVLSDFDRAVKAELWESRDMSSVLTHAQVERFNARAYRELFERFLLYGFNANARRLLDRIDVDSLPRDTKGWLLWIFAKTGINVLQSARFAIETTSLISLQSDWRRLLAQNNCILSYGSPEPPTAFSPQAKSGIREEYGSTAWQNSASE